MIVGDDIAVRRNEEAGSLRLGEWSVFARVGTLIAALIALALLALSELLEEFLERRALEGVLVAERRLAVVHGDLAAAFTDFHAHGNNGGPDLFDQVSEVRSTGHRRRHFDGGIGAGGVGGPKCVAADADSSSERHQAGACQKPGHV